MISRQEQGSGFSRPRRTLGYASIALLFLVLATGADSCSTQTKNTPAGKSRKARLGDVLTLKGFDGNLQMKVKVSRVIDPLPVGEFDKPESGKRFVGVKLTLRNVGQKTYDDSPSNGAHIITSTSEQADASFGVTSGACGGGFASKTTVAPGAKRVGCIPFELPAGQRAKTFQFGLESGFGPQSGEWKLR